MISIQPIKPMNEFNYWFIRVSNTWWNVYDRPTGKFICMYQDKDIITQTSTSEELNIIETPDLTDQEICEIEVDFDEFRKGRPEYLVGLSTSISDLNLEQKQQYYDNLFIGCSLCRGCRCNPERDVDSVLDRTMKILERLHKTSFYVDPASSIYHESHPGGLIDHCLKVVNEICDLHKVTKFNKVPYDQAVLVALVHDWCKIGLYEQYEKNVKDDYTGKWRKVFAYRRKDAPVPLGHGAASLHLAQQYFKFSLEESLAIRWHMGEYNVAPNEMNELHCANEQYPLVQMLQFADRLSITNY